MNKDTKGNTANKNAIKENEDNSIVGIKIQLKAVGLLILAMLITVYIFLKDYSLKDLIYYLKQCNPYWLLAGFFLIMFFIFCEGVNIKLIMKELNQSVAFKRCLDYSFIGFYFSSITPSSSGGQPAQIYYMKKDNLSVSDSSLTIFFVVLVYQIAMILIGGIMAVFDYKVAMVIAGKLKYLLIFGTITNLGFVLVLFLLMFSKKTVSFIIDLCVKIGLRVKLLKDPDKWKERLNQGITAYHEKALILKKHPVLFGKVLVVTFFQLIALCLVPYMVYKSLGYGDYKPEDMITAQSLLTIAVSTVPLPGSVGAAEGGFLYAFGMFFSDKVITLAMVLSRVISFYLPLLVSFFISVIIHVRTHGNIKRGDT